MEEERVAVEAALTEFGSKLDALEGALRPLLAAVDEVRSGGVSDDVPPLMRARVDATLAYALNAIFCMYLRTQGQDPTSHPVRDEISRVRSAYVRIQDIDKGQRSKPRKRSHASLYVAEEELAKVLTDGERALHQAANGRMAPTSDGGIRKTFDVSSDDGEENGCSRVGGNDSPETTEVVKTPKATKRRRSESDDESSSEAEDDSGSDVDSDAKNRAASAEAEKKEEKRRKKEKRERKERRKEKSSSKKTPKSDRREGSSVKKRSSKKGKKEKSGKKKRDKKKNGSVSS